MTVRHPNPSIFSCHLMEMMSHFLDYPVSRSCGRCSSTLASRFSAISYTWPERSQDPREKTDSFLSSLLAPKSSCSSIHEQRGEVKIEAPLFCSLIANSAKPDFINQLRGEREEEEATQPLDESSRTSLKRIWSSNLQRSKRKKRGEAIIEQKRREKNALFSGFFHFFSLFLNSITHTFEEKTDRVCL